MAAQRGWRGPPAGSGRWEVSGRYAGVSAVARWGGVRVRPESDARWSAPSGTAATSLGQQFLHLFCMRPEAVKYYIGKSAICTFFYIGAMAM